jgi:PEGA domain
MDFLDPKKQRAHTIRLFAGYVLVVIALILTTTILLYQAYGFGVDKHGQIIQNGLVFVSSTPNPANVIVNGQMRDQTNTRLNLPAGQYTFEVTRDGYRNWKRAVSVEGGSVEHFDYPFLFPTKLAPSAIKKYDTAPALALQSPDRRWMLVQQPDTLAKFDVLDLNAKKPIDTLKTITLPDSLIAQSGGTWELAEWSTDNRHVLLKHLYQKDGQAASEYVIVDRQSPEESVNLTTKLGVNPTKIELRNKKYDQYYLYDQAGGKLSTATLKEPQPVTLLDHVLDFKSHGSDVLLYATTKDAAPGKVALNVRDGDKTYPIRQTTPSAQYLLNITQYSGSWFVAAGSQNEDKVYVYKDPMGQLNDRPDEAPTPIGILKITAPNYVAFSDNARFIMAENADHFAVYDAENDKAYAYATKQPLDAPQAHASWMDGHRLTYVSNDKVIVFDFDSANRQTLVAHNSVIATPLFDQRYKYLYTFGNQASNGSNQTVINATPLRTPSDL